MKISSRELKTIEETCEKLKKWYITTFKVDNVVANLDKIDNTTTKIKISFTNNGESKSCYYTIDRETYNLKKILS